MEHKKPPIGVMPRFIWEENRLIALKGAIDRFTEVNQPIPIEWIEEYNELVGEGRKSDAKV